MASIEKRGEGYRVRWRALDGGPRSRQCPDRATARRLKAEVEREQALGRDWTPALAGSGSGPPTLAAVVAAYLEDAGRRLKPGTVARKRAVLGVLLGFLSADRPALASDLSRTNLHRWHASLTHIDRRTAAAYLAEASTVWRWAFESDEWGEIVPRPRSVDPGPVPAPRRIAGPTLEQVDAAIAEALTRRASWYGRVMLVMRYTGLRAGQVRRLEWADVDLDAGRLVIRGELGKSRGEQRGRVVPLHPSLVAELSGWGRREGPLVAGQSTETHRRVMASIWRATGTVPRQPLHGIRHAVATHLRSEGVADDVIGALLGHTGSVTREHYIDPAALWSLMVDAVGKIPPVGVRGVSTSIDDARKTARQ